LIRNAVDSGMERALGFGAAPLTSNRKDIDMKTPVAVIIASAIPLGALAGCNTVEGVGKDVRATGQGIERAADENKTYQARTLETGA
jgi:predicted small secreted protein